MRQTVQNRRRTGMPAAVMALAVALILSGAAQADTQDINDLRQAMRDAVAKAGPAVVRLIVPKMTDLDKAEARRRKREERLLRLEAEEAARKAKGPSDDEGKTPPKEGDAPAEKPGDNETKPSPPVEPTEGETTPPAKEAESDGDDEKEDTEPKDADSDTKTAVRTATIISADGYLITSRLNVGQQHRGILVRLSDGRELPAKRLGEDIQRDVVLLKIDLEGYDVPKVVSKSDLAVGQWVVALGRALPVEMPSVSKGIISALGRMAGTAIQTDANISALNYGGALVGLDGRLVAMIASVGRTGSSGRAEMFSDSGIGFAIPIADIMDRLDDLKAGKRLELPFLGIRFNNQRLGKGAQIENVIPATAAQEAGLRIDDVILRIDGVEIKSAFQLQHEVGSRKVGDEIAIEIDRGGEIVTLKATLKARPEHLR